MTSDGDEDGIADGNKDGDDEGATDGLGVGFLVATAVDVGTLDGASVVGRKVGAIGADVGDAVGGRVNVGLAVGNSVNPATKHSNSPGATRFHPRLASSVSSQGRSSTSPLVVPVSTTH